MSSRSALTDDALDRAVADMARAGRSNPLLARVARLSDDEKRAFVRALVAAKEGGA